MRRQRKIRCKTCRNPFKAPERSERKTCSACSSWWNYWLNQPSDRFVSYLRRLERSKTRVFAFKGARV